MNLCPSFQEKIKSTVTAFLSYKYFCQISCQKKWILNLADHLLHDTAKFKDSHG